MIYLDNSATTKPCEAAIKAAREAMETGWGNPSSLHDLGLAAERTLKTARLQLAGALGCEADRAGRNARHADLQVGERFACTGFQLVSEHLALADGGTGDIVDVHLRENLTEYFL